MTSDTSPSGVCSASTVYGSTGEPAWHAFDQNDTSFWASISPRNPGTSEWIQYQFPNRVCAKKWHIEVTRDQGGQRWTLTASNNNSNWETLAVVTSGTSILQTVDLDNVVSYLYYRITCANHTSANNYWYAINEIQLYG